MLRIIRAAILACVPLLFSVLFTGLVRADVPRVLNLSADAQQAQAMGAPLLLVFVDSHCAYCEVALNDFLVPMSGNKNYAARVLMRRIVRDSNEPMRDFDDSLTTHKAFARKIGVRMTPVVQMFSSRGQLLGKPLAGLTTIDYYGYYLDQIIDQAVVQVRNS
jgi:thioredoxin-related protein